MNAMNFAWSILKNDPLEPHERRDWDNHYSLMSMADVKQLDLSGFEAGVYNLILIHNNLRFTKKIVKQ